MIWMHDHRSARLQRSTLHVKDKAIQLGPNWTSVIRKSLVVSTVFVTAANKLHPSFPLAPRNVQNGTHPAVKKTLFIKPPKRAVVGDAVAEDNASVVRVAKCPILTQSKILRVVSVGFYYKPWRPLTLPKVSHKLPNPLVSVTEGWKSFLFWFFSTLVFWCFSRGKGIFHTLRGCRGGFKHHPRDPTPGQIS